MINTNNLKKGIVLKLDGNVLYEVIEANHYKPGKGNAFVRAKMRNLSTNNVSLFELSRKFTAALDASLLTSLAIRARDILVSE